MTQNIKKPQKTTNRCSTNRVSATKNNQTQVLCLLCTQKQVNCFSLAPGVATGTETASPQPDSWFSTCFSLLSLQDLARATVTTVTTAAVPNGVLALRLRRFFLVEQQNLTCRLRFTKLGELSQFGLIQKSLQCWCSPFEFLVDCFSLEATVKVTHRPCKARLIIRLK